MAREIHATLASGLSVATILVDATGRAYNAATPGFEAILAADAASYSLPLAATDIPTFYAGDMPAGVAAGRYAALVYARAGAALVLSDLSAAPLATVTIEWGGTAPVSTASVLAALASVAALIGPGGVNLTATQFNGPAVPEIQAGLATAAGLAILGSVVAALPTAATIQSGLATAVGLSANSAAIAAAVAAIPAAILATPANKLATDSSGHVATNNFPATVVVADKTGFKLDKAGLNLVLAAPGVPLPDAVGRIAATTAGSNSGVGTGDVLYNQVGPTTGTNVPLVEARMDSTGRIRELVTYHDSIPLNTP